MGVGVWRLEGRATPKTGSPNYSLGDKEGYSSKAEVLEAAQEQLRHLEETQPTRRSGGQREYGIQDHVIIVGPDGIHRRVLPNFAPT